MPIPVHIVGGFLGVGKTTALTALVASRAGTERVAVVVNDFGEAAIDAARMEGVAGSTVQNIPGGCICCTAPEGLVRVVNELLDVQKPDRIYIEPSGLGRPRDVVDMLARGGIASRVDMRPVVVIVDPARLDLSDPLMFEQWEGGDVLVVNRMDVSSPEQIEKVRAAVAEKWPAFIAVVETTQGVLPGDFQDWRREGATGYGLRATGEEGGPRRPEGHEEGGGSGRDDGGLGSVDGGSAHGHDHGDGDDAHDHDHGGRVHLDAISSTANFAARSGIFPPTAMFTWDGVRRAVENPAVQRFKGMFRADVGWIRVDVAGGKVDIRGTPWRRDSRFDVIVRSEDSGALDTVVNAIVAAEVVAGPSAPCVMLVDAEGNGLELRREAFAKLGAIEVASRMPGRAGTAVMLTDVLALLSPGPEARVVLGAADGMVADPVRVDALGDALLVYALDGGDLPAGDGGPFRVLVPKGVSACASVKGLCRVRVM